MSVKVKRVKSTVIQVQGNPGPPSGDCLEQRDHPLLNDLVLKTLFGFVRRYDLIACRVVSKKWNLHTLPQIQNKFKVTIRGSQTNCKTGQDTRRIQNFVELFRSNELGIPFIKFQLGPFRTTDGAGQQFLQLCGETATEIDLNEVNDGKSEVYTVEDVSELLRSCPNIKVLDFADRLVSRSGNIVKLFPDSMPTFSLLKKITFRTDYYKERLKSCPTSIEELLTATPNISDISVSDVFEDDEEENTIEEEGASDIGIVLNMIEKLRIKSSIQSLHLNSAKIDKIENVKRMANDGLKLKSLNLGPYLFGDDRVTLQIQLATIFKDTLQSLNVEEYVDNILMEFPNMPQLKSLSLQICYDFDPKPANLNINFPALRELEIEFVGSNEEDWDEFFSEFEVCPTLKSLTVNDEDMKLHTILNITGVFPNLTKLSMRIGADGVEVLRHIWSQMIGLESLSIWGYIERKEKDYLDSLFTGIPTQALKRITDVVNSLDRMTVQRRRETIRQLQNDHSRLPSIRNLTKLRHLFMHLSGGENCQNWVLRRRHGIFGRSFESGRHIHFTDFTAYLALHSMSHLRHVHLIQCKITNSCCEILTKETGLESWSFRNVECEDIISPFVRHVGEVHYN